MISLYIACVIAMILLTWLNSDAVVEWGKILGLSNFLKIDEFYKARIDFAPATLSYPKFLHQKYHNFFTALVSCPLCLTTWFSIWLCFSFGFLLLQPVLILFIPVVCVLTLLIYGTITSLNKLV